MTPSDSLADVPGVAVGHAQVPGGGSGCTVVLGPFRARVDVRGPATGSRELETLRGEHVTPGADALLLTGGSAFGLAAADGVSAWLEERGRGYRTRMGPVPIVPGAVIFDLAEGRGRPGPEEGRRACEAAGGGTLAQGRVGAGAGASVGKLLGPARSSPSGFGSASLGVGPWAVGALAVVNAVGEVADRDGRVVAGVRGDEGFVDATTLLLEGGWPPRPDDPEAPREGENTTLAVVATDAPLAGFDLERVGRLASTALARRISPVHTPFDGDVTFVASTGDGEGLAPGEVLLLGVAARETLETAIVRAAVEAGRAAPGGADRWSG